MTKNLSPTITLAKLYETQGQSIDALQIYKKLNLQKPSPDLEGKINELKKVIFSKKTKYNKLIDKIFSLEEKEKFGILTSQQFKEFIDSHAEHKELETYPEEMLQKKMKEDIVSEDDTKVDLVDENKDEIETNNLNKEIENTEKGEENIPEIETNEPEPIEMLENFKDIEEAEDDRDDFFQDEEKVDLTEIPNIEEISEIDSNKISED